MTHPAVLKTQSLILAGEISEAEAQLVAIAEESGDHALVAILDELAPKDVLAIMREYDSSSESVVNLVVSPEQFVSAIALERKYGEPFDRYVPRLRNTMNAVMHRDPASCSEMLACLVEHDDGIRLLADYFTDHHEQLLNFAFHGRFDEDVDVERAWAPKRVHTFDAEELDDVDQGDPVGDEFDFARAAMSRSEAADGDWMETAWILRHEFEDSFGLLIIEIKDRIARLQEAAVTHEPVRLTDGGRESSQDDEESAI